VNNKCGNNVHIWVSNPHYTNFLTPLEIGRRLSALLALDFLPKGRQSNQQDFIDCTFPDLKKANINCHRRKAGQTFWVHMDNSVCHQGFDPFDQHLSKSGLNVTFERDIDLEADTLTSGTVGFKAMFHSLFNFWPCRDAHGCVEHPIIRRIGSLRPVKIWI
jgi:hypothetical protein